MSLKTALQEATKTAMKEKNKSRLSVLRGFSAAIKQREIDERIELDETNQLAVLDKQIKQRKDSENQYREAGRVDLANIEAEQIMILSEFLPKQLDENEIAEIILKAISEVEQSGMGAMGKVMAIVKPQVQGKADIGAVSQLVKSKL